MYELIQASENAFYIQSPAKIGIISLGENRVCLIDSGNHQDTGKKVKRILDEKGWSLQAIYNTHSHADHIGGNQYLQKQTGCRIYAPGIEQDFTEHPILEPAFLYGGNPPKDLRHKFLMAQPCDVLPLTEESLPEEITILPLPGHSWDMVGYRTRDGVIYLADALASQETLDKYQVSFLVDVGAYLATLEAIKRMDARLFIPSHAEPTDNILPLAELNIRKTYEIAETIVNLCASPTPFEILLKRLFDRYRLEMTFEQYALVGSTVRSYLSWLKENGRVQTLIQDNMVLWQAQK